MTIEEVYQDYVVLRLAGQTKEEALEDLSTYVHSITLSRLQDYITAMESQAV